MASPTADRLDLGADRLRGGLRWFVSVPVRRETYRRLAYLLLAFPLGIAYFVFLVVGLSVGISLSILVVGLPILVVVLAATLLGAQFERWLVTRLLPAEINGSRRLEGDRRRDRALDLLTDVRTWTPFVYLPSVFLLGLVSFVVLTTGLSTALAMLLVPLYYDQPGLYVGFVTDRAPEFHQTVYLAWNQLLVGFEAVVTVGYWEITTLPQALTVAAGGLLLGLLTLHALNGLGWVFGRYAKLLLEGGYDVTALIDSS
ncbi:sensor domain-containing protein [Natronococcus sp.]|uniref:sensor domain-containing protein n=1 Tax=Natronococcus sp. TaxID=35747 RepID=UPI0025F136DD|nr:sensor domain-containing protein [Natronococcus sp.]